MPESVRAFVDHSVDPQVRGSLHAPDRPTGRGLILTHGAGSNANAPLLVALAESFAATGWTILRCDLPYRQARSWGPPGPGDAARDRAGLKNAIACLRKVLGAAVSPGGSSLQADGAGPPLAIFEEWGRLYLGGHSYGGRQSSMLCASLAEDERDLVAGLLLLSYPLHPSRKPEQQRTQHLPHLRTPTLFVHGSRDPLGSIAEIEQARKMIPAKTGLFAIDGAGHDLAFKGKAKQPALPAQIRAEFNRFFALSSPA